MSRWIPWRELASVAKAVSGSSHSLDQFFRVVVVDLAAQAAHENLEHIRERIVVLVPDVRRDGGTVNDLTVMDHEKLEQRELLGGQLYRVSRAAHSVGVEIDLEIRDSQRLRQW